MKRQERRRMEIVDLSKHERLHELLGALDNSQISVETFRKLMVQSGLTDDDIDSYCRNHGGWSPPSAIRVVR
jgi:hypothetical protein